MTGKSFSTTAIFIAACAGMAYFGIAMLSLGPILGPLNAQVEGANALPATLSAGIIAGTILFGPVVDRFGYKWLLILSSFLALAGLQGLSHFRTITLLHTSIFCLGLGSGILNGETNALVSDIYDDTKRAGRLAILGSFYCIGALLCTLFNYIAADFRIPLNVFSVLMAGYIIYFCIISFPQAKQADGQGASLKQSIRLLKYPALLIFGAALFFQSGFEGSSGSFTVSYLNNVCGTDNAAATLALTWFTIGMLAGRLPLGRILAKLKELATLYLYLGLALVGILGFTFLGKNIVMAYIAMTLVGFGVGATFPVVLNFIGSAFRAQSGTAFSIALFIALAGQSLFNKLTGIAFDKGSFFFLPIALTVALIMIMALIPAALAAARKHRNK